MTTLYVQWRQEVKVQALCNAIEIVIGAVDRDEIVSLWRGIGPLPQLEQFDIIKPEIKISVLHQYIESLDILIQCHLEKGELPFRVIFPTSPPIEDTLDEIEEWNPENDEPWTPEEEENRE